jgi:predicted nucleic acid-binding protein
LLDDVTAAIIGPVRQELLSGIRDPAQFSRLRDRLAALSDTPINSEDYIAAAEHSNTCRRHGLQGSSIDFLICAVAIRYHWPVLTTDTDFVGYAQHLPLTLDIYPA